MKNCGMRPLTNKIYTNPIPIENKGEISDEECIINGDPFVMKYNGEYYCYSTGDQTVNLLHSVDLVHFDHLGGCIRDPGRYSFWAPCVIYLNGTFYMYYSSMQMGAKDPHEHSLRVATASSPYGPFIYQKQLLNPFSIDPHVVKDDSGRLYIFYSVNNYSGTDRNFPGTAVLMDKMNDPYTLAGDAKPVILGSVQEEIFQKNRFGDGRDWYTLEGAFYFTKGDTAYITYSANAFTNPTYFLGYAKADKKSDIRECDWEKQPNSYDYAPLVCQNSKVGGTGHNSVVKAPNNTDDWIVYHGYTKYAGQPDMTLKRAMRIDPINYGIKKIYKIDPSSDEQDAPAEPLYRNIYNTKSDKEAYLAGDWRIADSCLCQDNLNSVSGMYLKNISIENYILETNVKWHRNHLGGKYGMFAAYCTNRNNVQVTLNEGDRCVEICGVLNGCQTDAVSVKLDRDFDFEAFHKLTVKRTGKLFILYVDDVFKIKATYDLGNSSVGFISYYTGADYDSLELTEYLELTRDNMSMFAAQTFGDSNSLQKNWVMKDGKLICYAVDSNKLLMNHKGDQYRFTASMKQKFAKSEAYCGVYAAYYDENNYIEVLLNTVEKKISIKECKDGNVKENVLEPKDPEMTTITVKRYKDRIMAMVDSQTVLQSGTAQGESYCGLCANVITEFSGIELLTI